MTGFGGGSSKMDPRPGDAIRLWRSTKLLRIFVVSGAGVAPRHDCSVAASRDEYALYRQQPAQPETGEGWYRRFHRTGPAKRNLGSFGHRKGRWPGALKKGPADLNPEAVYGEFRNLSLKSAGSARILSVADQRS
jgi:hypothetical protein